MSLGLIPRDVIHHHILSRILSYPLKQCTREEAQLIMATGKRVRLVCRAWHAVVVTNAAYWGLVIAHMTQWLTPPRRVPMDSDRRYYSVKLLDQDAALMKAYNKFHGRNEGTFSGAHTKTGRLKRKITMREEKIEALRIETEGYKQEQVRLAALVAARYATQEAAKPAAMELMARMRKKRRDNEVAFIYSLRDRFVFSRRPRSLRFSSIQSMASLMAKTDSSSLPFWTMGSST